MTDATIEKLKHNLSALITPLLFIFACYLAKGQFEDMKNAQVENNRLISELKLTVSVADRQNTLVMQEHERRLNILDRKVDDLQQVAITFPWAKHKPNPPPSP